MGLFSKSWGKLAAKASGSRVSRSSKLTHRMIRTRALPLHSTDIADPPTELEERSSRDLAPSTFNHTELIASETSSHERSLPTFSRADSITSAEAYTNLSREQLLDILAMFIGALPCIWHLSRVSLTAYVSVLDSTPRLAAPAFAVFSFPVLWFTARSELPPQKIRLMSYIANIGNWLILTVELLGLNHSFWLWLNDILLPAWEPVIVASELQWIVVLLSACVVYVISITADIFFLFFVLDGELDGSIGNFTDRLFSESNQ